MKIHKNGWVHQLMRQMAQSVEQSMEEQKLYRTALESAYEGIVVADRDGYVLEINDTYASFIERDRAELIGKHVTEVIENTRLHIVAKSGKPEFAELQKVRGHWMIANRIPVFSEGEIIAVVGKIMFQDIDKLFAMNAKYKEIKAYLQPSEKTQRSSFSAKYRLDHIKGSSPALAQVKAMSAKVANSNSTVLLIGESGTGKELFAHAIHQMSKRFYAPFVTVNCSAIPESLFESELFGYKEGSFTGANKAGKPGKFAMANKGTIFLDEIGELSLSMQAKLLRVLQEKEIEPVGGKPEVIDIRVIAATNRDLELMIDEGTFRRDLYYRLHVVELRIPPLRDRTEDIPSLCETILHDLQSEHHNSDTIKINPDAMLILQAHTWPGNVRELRNVLERTLYVIEDRTIAVQHLPAYIKQLDRIVPGKNSVNPPRLDEQGNLKERLEQVEREWIEKAVFEANGDKRVAAERLGISRSVLYAKLDKFK